MNRKEAIAACERIEQLNAQIQTNCANILRILNEAANRDRLAEAHKAIDEVIGARP
jgi:hypothetical protein